MRAHRATPARIAAVAVLAAGSIVAAPLASASDSPGVSASWSATGSMHGLAGEGIKLTLGPDGKVVAVQGSNAELYDPATGRWTATNPPAQSAIGGSHTTLDDGRVLAAGGLDGRAQIYDPATDTWTETGRMTTPRDGHRAVKLADGRVLVVGGRVAAATSGVFPPTQADIDAINAARLSSAEIYDPATGVWSETGDTGVSRFGGVNLVRLADGRVLVSGGSYAQRSQYPTYFQWYNTVYHGDTRLFDPATGQWTRTADRPEPQRTGGAHLRSNGSVIIIRAHLIPALVYWPSTERWEFVTRPTGLILDGPDGVMREVPNPPVPPDVGPGGLVGHGFTSVLLADGRVLAAGGFYFSCHVYCQVPVSTAAVYG